jgi:hypothetical protein
MNQKDIERAINDLEHILDHLPIYHEYLQLLDISYERLGEVKEMTFACMELQVAKKPIWIMESIKRGIDIWCECPACGYKDAGVNEYTYCFECGQKMCWEADYDR